MDKAEPPSRRPGSPPPPADARARLLGRSVDLAVALALGVAVGHRLATAGLLACGAYLLFSDALFGSGRSLGKRLMGLRCICLRTGRAAHLGHSLRRNAVFAAALIPAALALRQPWLWAVACLGAACALEAGVALQPLLRDLGRRRLGDRLAGTQVIDSSIALPLAAAPQPSRASRRPALTSPSGRAAREALSAKPSVPLPSSARPGPGVRHKRGPSRQAACASP